MKNHSPVLLNLLPFLWLTASEMSALQDETSTDLPVSRCANCLHNKDCANANDSSCTFTEKCTPGYFGPLCTKVCPQKCTDSGCSKNSGHCLQCIPGYFGDRCRSKCLIGFHGDRCRYPCPLHCQGGTCDHVTGLCESGCQIGFLGGRCDIGCPAGTYGRDCLAKCSVTCRNRSLCHPGTGVCQQGCAAGFRGPLCLSLCHNGTYGHNCSYRCSQFCVDQTCNIFSGHCDSCVAGMTGLFCESSFEDNALRRESSGDIEAARKFEEEILRSPKIILSSLVGLIGLGLVMWGMVALVTYYKHKLVVSNARKAGQRVPSWLARIPTWRGKFANIHGKRRMYTSPKLGVRSQRQKLRSQSPREFSSRVSSPVSAYKTKTKSTIEYSDSVSGNLTSTSSIKMMKKTLKKPHGFPRLQAHTTVEISPPKAVKPIEISPQRVASMVKVKNESLSTAGDAGDWQLPSEHSNTALDHLSSTIAKSISKSTSKSEYKSSSKSMSRPSSKSVHTMSSKSISRPSSKSVNPISSSKSTSRHSKSVPTMSSLESVPQSRSPLTWISSRNDSSSTTVPVALPVRELTGSEIAHPSWGDKRREIEESYQSFHSSDNSTIVSPSDKSATSIVSSTLSTTTLSTTSSTLQPARKITSSSSSSSYTLTGSDSEYDYDYDSQYDEETDRTSTLTEAESSMSTVTYIPPPRSRLIDEQKKKMQNLNRGVPGLSQTSAGHHQSRQRPESSAGHQQSRQRPEKPAGYQKSRQRLETSAGHQQSRQRPETSVGNQKSRQRPVTSAGHRQIGQRPETSAGHRQIGQRPETSAGHQKSRQRPETSAGHQKSRLRPETSAGHRQIGQRPETSAGHQQSRQKPETSEGHQQNRQRPVTSADHQQSRQRPETSAGHQQSRQRTALVRDRVGKEDTFSQLEMNVTDKPMETLDRPERPTLRFNPITNLHSDFNPEPSPFLANPRSLPLPAILKHPKIIVPTIKMEQGTDAPPFTSTSGHFKTPERQSSLWSRLFVYQRLRAVFNRVFVSPLPAETRDIEMETWASSSQTASFSPPPHMSSQFLLARLDKWSMEQAVETRELPITATSARGRSRPMRGAMSRQMVLESVMEESTTTTMTTGTTDTGSDTTGTDAGTSSVTIPAGGGTTSSFTMETSGSKSTSTFTGTGQDSKQKTARNSSISRTSSDSPLDSTYSYSSTSSSTSSSLPSVKNTFKKNRLYLGKSEWSS